MAKTFSIGMTILCAVLPPGITLESSPPVRIISQYEIAKNSTKPKLTIPLLINLGGNLFPLGQLGIEGVKIALDALYNASILSQYQLVVEAYDEQCDAHPAIKIAADLLNSCHSNSNNLVPLIVGSNCGSNTYTGAFVQHYNFTELAAGSVIYATYTKRSLYESIFFLLPSPLIPTQAMGPFFRSNGWNNVYLLSEAWDLWQDHEVALMETFRKNNITLAGGSTLLGFHGIFPTPDIFDMAVRDLAKMKPRVIVVLTIYGSFLACYFHKYNLYGPGIVIVIYGAPFTPRTNFRFPWCTNKMLLEVQQSIVSSLVMSPINVNHNAVDALGMTRRDFEDRLKKVPGHPEMEDFWFFWRFTYYDQIVASTLTIAKVDKTLNTSSNSSLLDWVTNSDRFRRNGSFFHTLLKDTIRGMRFKSFTIQENEEIMAPTGEAAIFQMQMDETGANRVPVPVATYDSKLDLFKHGPNPYIWNTVDGHPPSDVLRILSLKMRVIDKTAHHAIIGIAAVLLLANLAFIGVSLWCQFGSVNHAMRALFLKSMPELNLAVAIGNFILLSAVFIIPAGYVDEAGVEGVEYCIASSFLIVFGFSIISSAIHMKLHVATAYASNGGQVRRPFNVALQSRISTIRRISTNVTAHNIRRPTPITISENEVAVRVTRGIVISTLAVNLKQQMRSALSVALAWSLVQLSIIVVWFAIEPPRQTRFDRELEQSPYDISLQWQHYTVAFKLSLSTDLSSGFFLVLVICYLLVFLRCVYFAFFLRNVTVDIISDLHFVRTASYSIGILVIVGGVVISVFFGSNDPSALLTAVLALILIVSFLVLSLILLPKFYGLRKAIMASPSRNIRLITLGPK